MAGAGPRTLSVASGRSRVRTRRILVSATTAGLVIALVASVRPTVARAAVGDITTIAGTGSAGYSGDTGSATSAQLNQPIDAVQDAAGNTYVADLGNAVVRKIDTSGVISTFAGNGTAGFSGDGGPATSAQLNQPFGLLADSGNLYIADQGTGVNRIRVVNLSTGIISEVAGNGSLTPSGEGGPATSAGIGQPQFMVKTSAGFFFTDDVNNRVMKIDSGGILTTFASGISAALGLGADPSGNLYATSFNGNVVDKIDTSGTVAVVAGNGSQGYSGDGGRATSAQLNGPYDVKVLGGALYISEWYNSTVRKVDLSGTISTIAGTGSSGYSGDGGPATAAQLSNPTGLAFTNAGDLMVADFSNNVVRRIQGRPDLLSLRLQAPPAAVETASYSYKLLVVNDGTAGGATGVTVTDTLPSGVTFSGATSSQGSCSPSGSVVTCAVGAMPAGTIVSITLNVAAPGSAGTAVDQAAVSANETDPYTADNSATASTSIVSGSAGIIYTVAGNGNGAAGYSGDGGPATGARLNMPTGLRTDGAGNAYFADTGNNVVRKIDPLGTITTVAGNGQAGHAGDGGPATAAQLTAPSALAIDQAGNIFIADSGDTANGVVRKVDPSGMISTVAGGHVAPQPAGDGGPAASASIPWMTGVAVDGMGYLYIAEGGPFDRIRRVDPVTGIITTPFFHFFNPATYPELPAGMFVDQANQLYVAMRLGSVWKIDLASGTQTIVAGSRVGSYGLNAGGDGGLATSATLGSPTDVAVDAAGNLYIADATPGVVVFGGSDNAIRKVDTHGVITTVAGSVTPGYSGDGGPATSALLNFPSGVAPLGNGRLMIADQGNNALRLVTGSPDLLSVGGVAPLTTASGAAFSYSLRVSNDGSAGTATGVTLSDPLPTGVGFVTATSSQGSCLLAGSAVTCSLGSVTVNSSAVVTVTVTAPATSTTVVTTASVAANETDPFTADNTTSLTTYVAPADLAVSLAATPNTGVDVGSPLAYTATVVNRGPTPATGVTLKNALPGGLAVGSITAAQGHCTSSGSTITCTLGNLAVGASASVTINVTPTATGIATDNASVSAVQVDQYAFNNSASLTTFISGIGCGMRITKSTKLTADIGPCGGDGVIIGADNIKVNLGGHRIFGRGTGAGYAVTDDLVGIRLPNRTGVTITGGTVSGFDTGIFINSGVQNTVTKMTVQDNIGQDANPGPVFPDLGDGILIEDSSFNSITSNVINHNGSYDGVGLFGTDTNSNLIQGNTIKNTVTSTAQSDGEGVIINNFLANFDPNRGPSLIQNNVIGNVITGNAASGISNVTNADALIENNTVTNNGLLAFPSNGIGDQTGKQGDPTTNDTISGNHVSGNGDDGIEILQLNGNTISGNVVSSNNVNNDGSFNLEDTNGNCTANTWSNNTSTNGAVFPPCLAPAGPSTAAPPSSARLSDPQANRRLPKRAG